MRRPEMGVRDRVLVVLASSLLASVLAFGVITYRGLQDEAMAGFDGLLVGVSSVTGGFVDAEDHDAFLEQRPRRLVGLARMPGQPWLVGIDSVADELVAVWPDEGGGAERLAPVEADSLLGLTRVGEHLVSRHARMGWVTVDRATGALAPAGSVAEPLARAMGGAPAPILDLTLHPERPDEGRLTAGSPPAVYAWDEAGVHPVEEPGSAGPPGPGDGDAPDLDGGALAWAPSGGALELFGAGGRLQLLDGATGRPTDRAFAAGFASEAHPDYQRYVRPMREIAGRLGLTYLYTQVLDSDGAITYGLDATVGPDHTPIGAGDVMPPGDLAGALGVLSEQDVYISRLQRWEQWGLLKSAFAPVLDEHGRARAMAGADIDVSVISEKTRASLALVGLLGLLGLVLGIGVALGVARSLTGPLGRLEDGALRLAAGELGVYVDLPEIHELRSLTDAFNTMSTTSEQRIVVLRERGRALERHRVLRTLDVASGDADASAALPGLTVTRAPDSVDPSGAAVVGPAGAGRGAVLVWLASPSGDLARDLALRVSLTRLAARMDPADPGSVAALAPGLQARGVQALGVLDEGGAVWVGTAGEAEVRLDGHPLPAGPGTRLTLEPGTTLAFGRVAGAGEADPGFRCAFRRGGSLDPGRAS